MGRAPQTEIRPKYGRSRIIEVGTHQVSIRSGFGKSFQPTMVARRSAIWQRLPWIPQNCCFTTSKPIAWADWIAESGALGYLNWSQDGGYLYYYSTFTDHPTFRRVKVGHTDSELLVDLKGAAQVLSPSCLYSVGALSLPTARHSLPAI